MNKAIIHMTELTFIYSIGSIYGEDCQHGRLKNRYDKIIKLTGGDLQMLMDKSAFGCKVAAGLVQEFCESVGWVDKENKVEPIVSFCLGMIDESENTFDPRIIEALNDIAEYFDRSGELRGDDCSTGLFAAEKWRELIDGIRSGSKPTPVFVGV